MFLQRVKDAVFYVVKQLIAFCRVPTLNSCVRGVVTSLIILRRRHLLLTLTPLVDLPSRLMAVSAP